MALFGYSIARVSGHGLGSSLPDGSIVLFRRRRGVARGDVVLVDHPELGRVIRKVSAVGRKGNVHLQGTSRHSGEGKPLGKVPRECVLGVKVRRLRSGKGFSY